MKKLFAAVAAASAFLVSPAVAEVGPEHDHTKHAQGCMMLMECTEGVTEINSAADLELLYPRVDWTEYRAEADAILRDLAELGIPVHVGAPRYFMRNETALYDTAYNRVWVNDRVAEYPDTFMIALRHEAWHAAQDCMAGGIDNGFMAVIHGEENTPPVWTDIATHLYPAGIVEWEAEAKWAGSERGMTADAIGVCVATDQRPWTELTPTPKTLEWLEQEGFTGTN